MSSKILLKFLGGCLALFIVVGINAYKADAQVVSGVTEEPSGQIVFPFDEREFCLVECAPFENDFSRHTHFQLTNTSRTTPVAVHIQLGH